MEWKCDLQALPCHIWQFFPLGLCIAKRSGFVPHYPADAAGFAAVFCGNAQLLRYQSHRLECSSRYQVKFFLITFVSTYLLGQVNLKAIECSRANR